MQRFELELFADYHQFYLWDSTGPSLAPEDYSDEDVRRMVKVAPGVVVVNPLRSDTVTVEVRIHTQEPELELDGCDHVVDGSLELPAGKLQVHECTGGPVLDVSLTPGTYGVRCTFIGLETLDEHRMKGSDRYRVDLWPSEPRALEVRKQWRNGGLAP